MEVVEYKFEKICRVCKGECDQMRSIFENDCPRIDEMLMACTTVVVDDGDGLPESICNVCCEKLASAYKFKQLCEETDACLRDYVIAKNIKVQKDPTNTEEMDQINTSNIKRSDAVSHWTLDDDDDEDEDDLEGIAAGSEDGNVEVGIKGEPDSDINCLTATSDYIQLLENNQLLVTCRMCSKCFTTLEGLKCHKRLHSGALFKCNTCGKQYTRQNHLQRHELTHGRRKIHVCKICNKTLTRFEHLKRHLITHLKEKPFSCVTCNRGFNRAEHLTNHVRRCKGDFVYVCDICNKSFIRKDSLEVHKHLHDNKEPQLPTLENLDNIDEHYLEIECDGTENPPTPVPYSDESGCEGEVDQDQDFFEPQVNIAENIEPNPLQTEVPEDEEEASANFEQAMDPSDIDEMEVYNEELSEEKVVVDPDVKVNVADDHYDSGGSAESEYLPKKRTKRKRGRPRKHFGKLSKPSARARGRALKIKIEPGIEEFQCSEANCSEVFTKVSLLDKHIQKHDSAKLHTCTICNKTFPRSNHLKRHMVSHSEIKPFNCEFCNKRFNRKDHMTQHTKLHLKTEQFECDICKKPFHRANQLAKHIQTKHQIGERMSGEKKYQCLVCMKCFTTEKYRDIHIKLHNGEKTFTCRQCEKTFVSKSHLIEHIKFHDDHSKKFLCSECGQRFIRNDYLVIHMRRHRGEKPFKCKFCGKGFPRTTDLTVHERYHTGEKTHLCTICGRGFGRAYNLTVHMRTHTGEKPYQCSYCEAAFAQGNDLKAHVRRHTGERFHCEYCNESFLMGYLLTQHKRTVHGMNIVSNIRRLNPVKTLTEEDPITVSLPPAIVPASVFNLEMQSHHLAGLLVDQK